MIYADFESILVLKDNGKQILNEPYTNKYQKHVACSYGYKLVCVDDKYSKPFKSYLGEDAVYSVSSIFYFISSIIDFISSIIEEIKCCCDVIRNHSNKRTCND